MVSLAQAILQRSTIDDEDDADRELQRELSELRARRCQLAEASADAEFDAANEGVSLAQAILQRSTVDDEDDADRELQRELSELRARRCQLAEASADAEGDVAFEGGQTRARSSCAAAYTRPVGVEAKPTSAAFAPCTVAERTVAHPKRDAKHKGYSLAEELLKRPSIENELAAMDIELEEQMAQLRKQMQTEGGALAAAVPVPASTLVPPKPVPNAPAGLLTLSQALGGTGGKPTGGSSQPLGASLRSDVGNTTGPAGVGTAGIGGEVGNSEVTTTAEVAKLMEDAAKMEEAFPIRAQGEEAAYQAARATRVQPSPALDLDQEREAVPIDSNMVDMQEALEGLDARLHAIQQHKVLQSAPSPTYEVPAHVSQAVAEMQAQNRHLRERMAAGTGGRLNLDATLFKAGPVSRAQ